ncbi:MAG: hypothetical protein FWG44_01910 [Oscillospiraceae bacterium]|nr:hypothetical protein [Oscillospiraceae bacterium]
MKFRFKSAIIFLICTILLLCSCNSDKNTVPEKEIIESEDLHNLKIITEDEEEINNEGFTESIDMVEPTRINEPKDIINGIPLFIEFEEDFIETQEQQEAKKYHYLYGGYPSVVIAYSGELFKIEMYRVPYYWEDETPQLGRRFFTLYGRRYEETPFVFYCTIDQWWNDYPGQVFILTDNNGVKHSYLMGTDRESGKLIIEKKELLKLRHGNQSIIDMIGKETVDVKFFAYDTERESSYYVDKKENYSYKNEVINVNNFADEFIHFMALHTGILVEDIWFEGKTIFIDLDGFGARNFDMGSSGSKDITMRILLTLANIPNVERVKVLIEGLGNAGGAHFDFTPIFNASYYKVD